MSDSNQLGVCSTLCDCVCSVTEDGKCDALRELRAEVEALRAQSNDLALWILRLITRLNAARECKGLKEGDNSTINQAMKYLLQRGLHRPDCGEAGHDAGKCGNASCFGLRGEGEK